MEGRGEGSNEERGEDWSEGGGERDGSEETVDVQYGEVYLEHHVEDTDIKQVRVTCVTINLHSGITRSHVYCLKIC